MFQNLLESLPRRVQALTAAKRGCSSILIPGMKFSSTYGCDVQVSTYLKM
uniref:Uncharacterized protein n=1 Tax=Anguilla anguilla TaxID=7936 RepID=A0A0E9V0S8_ANGAN